MRFNSKIFFYFLFIGYSFLFYSCADEGPSVPNTPGNPLKGVFVLYEGSLINTDYAYYDAINNNITNDVFRLSNSGILLGFNRKSVV